MPYTRFSSQQVESRGEAIYRQQIRGLVEQTNRGKYLVIDIETGDYEVDDDDLEATKRTLAKRPGAVLYGLRIGYPAAYTLGGHIAAADR